MMDMTEHVIGAANLPDTAVEAEIAMRKHLQAMGDNAKKETVAQMEQRHEQQMQFANQLMQQTVTVLDQLSAQVGQINAYLQATQKMMMDLSAMQGSMNKLIAAPGKKTVSLSNVKKDDDGLITEATVMRK